MLVFQHTPIHKNDSNNKTKIHDQDKKNRRQTNNKELDIKSNPHTRKHNHYTETESKIFQQIHKHTTRTSWFPTSGSEQGSHDLHNTYVFLSMNRPLSMSIE